MPEPDADTLRETAKAHLWPTFGKDPSFFDSPASIITQGRGSMVTDVDGGQYLDATLLRLRLDPGLQPPGRRRGDDPRDVEPRAEPERLARSRLSGASGGEARIAVAGHAPVHDVRLQRYRRQRNGHQDGAAVPQDDGQREQVQGHRPKLQLPRHEPRHPRRRRRDSPPKVLRAAPRRLLSHQPALQLPQQVRRRLRGVGGGLRQRAARDHRA